MTCSNLNLEAGCVDPCVEYFLFPFGSTSLLCCVTVSHLPGRFGLTEIRHSNSAENLDRCLCGVCSLLSMEEELELSQQLVGHEAAVQNGANCVLETRACAEAIACADVSIANFSGNQFILASLFSLPSALCFSQLLFAKISRVTV